MIEFGRLKSPIDIKNTVEKDVDRAQVVSRNRKINFGKNKLNSIELDLKKKYDEWKQGTRGLKRRLIRYNDLLEGIVYKTNFPFEGASNITLRYAAGMARTYQTAFNRSLYLDPAIFMAVSNKLTPEDTDKAQDTLNYFFQHESNGLDVCKNGTYVCFRDGTQLLSVNWERRIERGTDFRVYKDSASFINDYPSPDIAGMSEEAYNAVLDKFIMEEDFEYHVEYFYDFIEFEGLNFEIVSLSDFVFWPLYAPAIKRMEVYGKSYTLSEKELTERANRNQYYKDRVNNAIVSSHGISQNQWAISRNYIDGISMPDAESWPYELADLVYKADLDDDGVFEKYLVTMEIGSGAILSIEHYPIRRNIDFVVDFRFLRREGRFLGASLLGDGEDHFNLLDSIHRHRNNTRMLVASPVLFMNKDLQQDLDPGRPENVIRPGMVIWAKPPFGNVAQQLDLRNLDQPGNSADEENLIVRYLELVIGPTQALSGRENPADPRSPMGKTITLMNQSNQRIDDYLDEYGKSFSPLAELITALLVQNGAGMKYVISKEGKTEQLDVDLRTLSDLSLKWMGKKRSITMSPEFAMQRQSNLMQAYAIYLKLGGPQNPVATELWNRIVLASGETDNEKLLVRQAPQPQLPLLPGQPQGAPGVPQLPQPGQPPPPQGIAELMKAGGIQ